MTKITQQQTDQAILNTFNSMEENVEYVLTATAVSEANTVRKDSGYSEIKREYHKFFRKGNKLFCNNNIVLDFDKTTASFAFAAFAAFALASGVVVLAFAFSFTLALQFNEIEKLNKDTLDGTLLVKDGRTYRLTLEKQ